MNLLEKQKLDTKLQHLYELSQSREFVLNSKIKELEDEINRAKIKYATDTLVLDNEIEVKMQYEHVQNCLYYCMLCLLQSLKKQINLLTNESATIAKDITEKYELKLAEKG